jgi:hypothetical protein
MATTIVTKSGSGAPTASDLVAGELAVDLTNKRLYTEDSGGTVLELGTNPSGNVTFGDNGKAIFGAGSDLQIYHDGSNSFIEDTDTGSLFLKTNGAGVYLYSGSEALATFNSNGANNFYYDNGLKLSTTASGIDVTGSVTTTGNVGIGAVPNSWGSTYEALSVGPWSTLGTFSNADGGFLVGNAYHDGTNWKYRNNGTAEQYKFLYGAHIWEYAASGTAGNTFSFSEAMRIDANGSVGVGTSTITSGFKMEVIGYARFGDAVGDDAVELGWSSGGAQGFIQAYDRGASAFRPLNINNSLTVDASGNVGIGTSSPDSKMNLYDGALHIQQTDGSDTWFGLGANNDNYITTGASGITVFRSVGTERMRIDASGNLLVGTTSVTGHKIASVATGSDRNLLMQCANGGSNCVTLNTSGTADYSAFVFTTAAGSTQSGSIVVGASSTAYNTSSDQRLKENIADADDAGSKIDAIQVRKFDWKADGSHKDYGMVAQELQLVAPEAVSGDADSEDMMGVDYSKLVPMMLKEIQSLRARIAALES